ncbi:hypothetical protein IFT37_15635 [Pseudomonas fluorescens]|uniref:Uncharacterized protein n=1 Tax=Pseudomonas fluorescens TaxID=294 RepID=A0AAE2PWD3_PSEFL|nr:MULTISPECIES: hypothetical protein [Pseudomonas fluorescens group]MBA1430847.1 hypothetical protein [Pseudomonas orientalis]MBD8151260.1 hypothetical protein [Pseudomonas fluorescens]MBD8179209.1 hypothetical protein [Pseudomonas fluorescens]MBD8269687.1 hypothetical protein [Pseudomonas fluorescens]MBD8746542.1 hypothetical protein [Pseudomonas fluorescens]
MQRRQHDTTSFHTRSSYPDERQYYCLPTPDGYSNSVLYRVVPAGKNFFHIQEVASGRIKGFRSDHTKACALAKALEANRHGTLVSSAG